MKHIICIIMLLTLANQMSIVYTSYPVLVQLDPKDMKSIEDMDDSELEAKQNKNYDPWWLKEHPEREVLIKNYKAWNSCVYSRRPRSDCDVLFEILVIPAQLIIAKVQSYRLLINDTVNQYIECLESEKSEENCSQEKLDKERITNELKEELHPWTEIYEICIVAKSKSFCEYFMKYLHLPEYRVMKPEGLIQSIKLIVCAQSGGSSDKCIEELKVPIVDMKNKAEIMNVHKKNNNELIKNRINKYYEATIDKMISLLLD